jgi:hypothetical protein
MPENLNCLKTSSERSKLLILKKICSSVFELRLGHRRQWPPHKVHLDCCLLTYGNHNIDCYQHTGETFYLHFLAWFYHKACPLVMLATTYEMTWCQNQEYYNLNFHCCQNLLILHGLHQVFFKKVAVQGLDESWATHLYTDIHTFMQVPFKVTGTGIQVFLVEIKKVAFIYVLHLPAV